MSRVVLYARFSTDLQRQTSIADQLQAARARAAAEAWPIVAEHADEGVSGSVPVMLRRGGKALLADALAARFDVLIVEGLDRLSRDMGEQDQVVKRLEYRGIRLIGTSDGYDSLAKGRKVMRVARGLVNELYLDDLRDKTHRGLAGQFGRGLSAGGRSFGYRTEAADGGRRMIIDEAEAVHVRWIFDQVAAGESLRAVVHQLNVRGVKSARGGTWAISALVGPKAKGLGLLRNELYIGRVIWNRRQWLKDPETGSRRYVERPPSEWQRRDAPELRVVPQAVWDLVQGRSQRAEAGGLQKRGRPARTLFGGLLVCPACEGAIVAINRERYACSVHKDRGPAVCANGASFRRELVDRRLVAELRDELLSPAALAELQQVVRQIATDHARAQTAAGAGPRRRLHELEGEISRLVDAIAGMGVSAALASRLKAAEAERAELERAAIPVPAPAAVVDNVIGRYRRQVLQLREAMEGDPDRDRTRTILAELLGPVRLVREESTGEDFAELQEPVERLLLAGVGESLNLVARARKQVWRRIRL